MADPNEVRTFSRLIAMHERGNLDEELTKAIGEITGELEEHYNSYRGEPKASLTLKLNFVREKNVITVSATVDKKLPPAPRAKAIYYATASSDGLTTKDPHQPDLPLRDVSQPSQTARDVS